MRRVAAVIALLVPTGVAGVVPLSWVVRGQRVARTVYPTLCDAAPDIVWRVLPGDTIARADWWRVEGGDRRCRLTYDVSVPWTWPAFCTLTVHERGHFAGLPHSVNPRSVMFWRPRIPFRLCGGRAPPR